MKAEHERTVSQLKRRVYQKEVQLEETRVQLRDYQRTMRLFELRQSAVSEVETPIPPQMLKRLIQLCHPDKHDSSTASLEVSQWLNGMRRNRSLG